MRYYTNIATCPMTAFRIALKGDYSGMKKGMIATNKGAYRAFVSVFDEADKAFNLSESYKRYLALRVQASEMYVKAINGQKHYYTRAKIKEAEAEQALGGIGSEISFEASCAMLSKKMGFPVRPSDVSVSEYYAYMDIKE